MKKATKTALLWGAILILSGIILFGGTMTMQKWNFTKFFSEPYKTTHHTITEPFESIRIEASEEDVELLPCADDRVSVICHDDPKIEHLLSVTNGTLTISANDQRAWYEHIGIHTEKAKISVFLPDECFKNLFVNVHTGSVTLSGRSQKAFEQITVTAVTGDVTIEHCAAENVRLQTDSGSVSISSLLANTLDLTVTTGKITLSETHCENQLLLKSGTGKTLLSKLSCKSLDVEIGTGDLQLNEVIAENALTVKGRTGKILLDRCDAGELYLETNTGDVKGSLLSEKIFIIQSTNGSVNVPETITGGKCKIVTNTGDVKITIQKESEE